MMVLAASLQLWLRLPPAYSPSRRPMTSGRPAQTASVRPPASSDVAEAMSARGKEPSPRAAFRQAHDYSLLIRDLKTAAQSGDPAAEYVTAKALRYCADLSKQFFRLDGSRKTLAELQTRMTNQPDGIKWVNEIYDHCRSFIDDPALLATTADWEKWLDAAVEAGYAPAQTEKADVLRVEDMFQDAQNATSGDVIPPTAGPARDLALKAVLSADPDSILGMANWVDGTKHDSADYNQLVNAWMLLACQRGHADCGMDSQLLRNSCMFDPQCADDSGVIDSMHRRLGTEFDDVAQRAADIGRALDAGDLQAIESFL